MPPSVECPIRGRPSPIETRLPPATPFTTSELSLRLLLDADGTPVAIATGSAMVLPGRPAALGALEE